MILNKLFFMGHASPVQKNRKKAKKVTNAMKGKYSCSRTGLSTSALICACLLAAFLFSFAYEIAEIHHDCTGHNCPICACIQQIENNRGQLTAALAALGLFLLIFFNSAAVLPICSCFKTELSLVQLKTKMTN